MSEMSHLEKALGYDRQRMAEFAAIPLWDGTAGAEREPSDWSGLAEYSAGAVDGDPVNHPTHYTDVIPDIEVIDITEHLNFNRGNVVKYLLRAGAKGGPGDEVQDLRKAAWYLNREISRMGRVL